MLVWQPAILCCQRLMLSLIDLAYKFLSHSPYNPRRHQTIAFCRRSNTEYSLRQHLRSFCRLTTDNLTCPMVNLGGHLRHFFFVTSFWVVGPRRSAQCDPVNCALEKHLGRLALYWTNNRKVMGSTLANAVCFTFDG